MSLSLRHEWIPSSDAFAADAYLSTFVPQGCQPCRIFGPGTLVRLVDGSRYNPMTSAPGEFWMEEMVFRSFMARAAADLASQNRNADPSMTGLYARFQLRDGLAVSRDWSNLDKYIILNLPPNESIIALVGPAAPQSYYSLSRPDDRDRTEAAGITLPGLTDQVIINFNHPANQNARHFVNGPYMF